MIPRTLLPYAQQDAGYYPVVTITGPRQSGKTTLAKAAFADSEYVSLEEPDAREFAVADPRGFLRRYSGRTIIDEVQRAPELPSYIQGEVDRDDTPGRYILTGSQNLLLAHTVAQSLAGRTGLLHLLPLSRAELEEQVSPAPASPPMLFGNAGTGLDPWEIIRTGFYPRIHDRGVPADVWLSDYLRTYVERDVRSLVNVGDLETFERFLGLCAGRTGQLLNYTTLAADAGISLDTARRWFSTLHASFIVFPLRPHHRNFNKRIIKSPKLYFYDTGLACRLLGIRSAEQLRLHPLRGAIFENYVVAELTKAYLHHRMEPPLYFWRDRTGHEVDIIIDDAGTLYPVEIKSGMTLNGALFDGLRRWTEISGESPQRSFLVYGGDETQVRGGVNVRPWYAV